MTKRVFFAGILLASFACAAGCGSSSPNFESISGVNGKVLTPKGSPLKGGVLLLRSTDGIRPSLAAEIQEDGSFSIDSASQKRAVVPGRYQVFVKFKDDAKHRTLRAQVPKKYQEVSEDASGHYVSIEGESDSLVVKLGKS